MFETAKQTKVFQDVVEQIQEAIFEGRLKTGDMLPAERELKEVFKVSRGTLREALRVLEQKGLIEIRLGVGGGSLVKQVDTEQVSESLGLLIRSQKVSLNHLAEFREDLEGIVAAHAARLCSQRAGDRLNDLLQRAQKCVRRGAAARDEFIRADKQLHLELARITGNPIYISVLHSIHDNIHRYYDRFLSMEQAELEENYQDLHNIVQAVILRKPHEARILAQDHVRRFNGYMQRREQQEQIAAQKRN
jgi:GntR family transcriptional regulator, transcriptional repressor for pyruvate dehydrogenase complex